MTFGIFPKYEDLLPGRPVPDLGEVLSRTSSVTFLKAFAFINSKVHLWHSNIAEQEDIFQKWIGAFGDETSTAILLNYLRFKQELIKEGDAAVLLSAPALLRLIEQVILHFNRLPEKQIKTVGDEMALFEAWLINNSAFDLEVAEGTEPVVENLLGVLLVNQAMQYEFAERKDFIYQTLLADAFFEFIATEPNLTVYLQEFLLTKKIGTYRQYLLHIVGVYIDCYTGNSFGFKLTQESADAMPFFDSIAYDLATDPFNTLPQAQQHDPDYKLLRTRPLIKEEDGSYYPLHFNFFIDKIYQGLLFDFYQHSSIREKYKNFGQFLGFLGQEFAETHLFYQYLVGCFIPKKYLIAVPGNQYRDIEYSDYYVREGNVLFLFEFKNSIVNAQIKQSKDFTKIKAELLKKLVHNPDNNKDKGIGQLLNVMQKIVDGGFIFDDFIGKRVGRLHIFPIIVHTDDFFGLNGVQTIISEEFQNMLIDRPIKRHQVNDVTLMHLQNVLGNYLWLGTGIRCSITCMLAK